MEYKKIDTSRISQIDNIAVTNKILAKSTYHHDAKLQRNTNSISDKIPI